MPSFQKLRKNEQNKGLFFSFLLKDKQMESKESYIFSLVSAKTLFPSVTFYVPSNVNDIFHAYTHSVNERVLPTFRQIVLLF